MMAPSTHARMGQARPWEASRLPSKSSKTTPFRPYTTQRNKPSHGGGRAWHIRAVRYVTMFVLATTANSSVLPTPVLADVSLSCGPSQRCLCLLNSFTQYECQKIPWKQIMISTANEEWLEKRNEAQGGSLRLKWHKEQSRALLAFPPARDQLAWDVVE